MTPTYMTPPYDQFAKFGEEAIATMVKTNAAIAKSFEQLTSYFSDLASVSLEETIAAGKKLAAVKSVTEFVEIQTKLAQTSFENLAQESKKASELTLAIVKDVSEPLTERFKSTVATATKSAVKASKAA